MITKTKITVKGWISLIFLLLAAGIIFLFSCFPSLVESYYSIGWYPKMSVFFRGITSKFPFSLGDTIYVLIVIYLIVSVIRFILVGINTGFGLDWLKYGVLKSTKTLLKFYIAFKLLWGLNYDRQGIAEQLYLSPQPYKIEEVTQLTNLLMDSLNEYRRQIKYTHLPYLYLKDVKQKAFICYRKLSVDQPYLSYHQQSVKPSLFSGAGDYFGFTGYFNPFSGEAQLRTDIPTILMPFIACHEMAHQLGYGSESEANFVGYLAASQSSDIYFKYSLYLELFTYAQSEEILWYGREKDYKAFDSIIRYNRSKLDTLVKKDRKEIRAFFQKRQKKVAPAFTSIYDQYLKLNKQASGVKSYDEVIGWLIAYRKKYQRF